VALHGPGQLQSKATPLGHGRGDRLLTTIMVAWNTCVRKTQWRASVGIEFTPEHQTVDGTSRRKRILEELQALLS